MYAEDTVIFYGAPSIADLELILNAKLKNLFHRECIYKLFIHPKKTEYYTISWHSPKTFYTNTQIIQDMRIIPDGKVTKRAEFYRYLGIYIDEHLSLHEHVTRLL